jgi:uncharacterized protein YktB (UPF0637 family)
MAQIDDWMARVEEQFNSQTPEQIRHLLNECRSNFEDDDMIMNIIKNVRRTNNISFRQWKALSAELSKHNNPTKKL